MYCAEPAGPLVESFRCEKVGHQIGDLDFVQIGERKVCVASNANILHISQEEIGRLAGISRQVAHRALHEFKEAGLLNIRYGTIDVLNVDGPAAVRA